MRQQPGTVLQLREPQYVYKLRHLLLLLVQDLLLVISPLGAPPVELVGAAVHEAHGLMHSEFDHYGRFLSVLSHRVGTNNTKQKGLK